MMKGLKSKLMGESSSCDKEKKTIGVPNITAVESKISGDEDVQPVLYLNSRVSGHSLQSGGLALTKGCCLSVELKEKWS